MYAVNQIDATCGLGILSLDIVHWLNKNKLSLYY
jgi:hypothetical protein